MGKWYEKILNLIYPKSSLCVSCLKQIDDEFICKECFSNIKFNKGFHNISFDGFSAHYACYYLGSLKNIVYNFKVHKNFSCGDYLVDIMCNHIKNLGCEFDYLTYVPRDRVKIQKEGFDQSYYLTKKISEKLGIPYIKLVYCSGKKRDQKKLDLSTRCVNVKGKFFINNKEDITKITNKKLLLIDDIATTYNTLGEVYRIIKKSVFETDISVLTIAKTLI